MILQLVSTLLIENAGNIVSAGAIVAGAVAANYKLYSINKRLDKVDDIEVKVAKLVKETQINGGGTLKDGQFKMQLLLTSIKADVVLIKKREEARIYIDAQPTFECDANGYATFLNKALLDILGVDESEAIGYGWLKCVKNSDQDRVLREWEMSVRSGKEFNCNYTFSNPKTRTEIKVHGKARIERDATDIIFIVGTIEVL